MLRSMTSSTFLPQKLHRLTSFLLQCSRRRLHPRPSRTKDHSLLGSYRESIYFPLYSARSLSEQVSPLLSSRPWVSLSSSLESLLDTSSTPPALSRLDTEPSLPPSSSFTPRPSELLGLPFLGELARSRSLDLDASLILFFRLSKPGSTPLRSSPSLSEPREELSPSSGGLSETVSSQRSRPSSSTPSVSPSPFPPSVLLLLTPYVFSPQPTGPSSYSEFSTFVPSPSSTSFTLRWALPRSPRRDASSVSPLLTRSSPPSFPNQTAGRSLEEMDILFSSESMLVHNQEKDLALIEQSEPEIAQAVGSRSSFSSSSFPFSAFPPLTPSSSLFVSLDEVRRQADHPAKANWKAQLQGSWDDFRRERSTSSLARLPGLNNNTCSPFSPIRSWSPQCAPSRYFHAEPRRSSSPHAVSLFSLAFASLSTLDFLIISINLTL